MQLHQKARSPKNLHPQTRPDRHESIKQVCKPGTAPDSDCGNGYAEERDCEGVEVEDRGLRGGRMTPAQQPEFLLIKPSEFTELANVHTVGISPARIFEISIAVNDRSRPTPSAYAKETKGMSENEYDQWMIKHDTAIRNATLDDVKQYADTCIWIDDECCPDILNGKEDSDCDGCSYVNYPNNADIREKIISLRTQPQEPKP